MVRLFMVLMLALLAGMITWWQIEPDSRVADISPQAPMGSTSSSNTVRESEHPSIKQQLALPNADNDFAQQLATSNGRALRQFIESFWLTCRSEHDCSQRLTELDSSLAPELYQLIANYPQRKRQWQLTMGALELSQLASLSERVAEVKQQAQQVWGQEAHRILADEFDLYDFTLEAQTLTRVDAEEYVAQYQQLLERWRQKSANLGLVNELAIFEKAISLIPLTYTSSQRQQVVEQLSSLYLTPAQANEIAVRELQVASQTQQVADYQAQLSQLKQALNAERETVHGQMSDAQWQHYYQQQVERFRRQFFSSN